MATQPVKDPIVTTTEADRRHMAAALSLAERGLGRTWPNPSVGCILVRNGHVVGRGVTAPGGRPHAETLALQQAGRAAEGATAYVILEPCAHHGVTPPCCDALIAAKVTRVVVALNDPDPRTAGASEARMREAGLEVVCGVMQAEARELQEGFLTRITKGRPLTTLKVAATLDGRIATGTGNSKWITGDAARRAGHALRANHDAILIGSGTALADDPSLTCRLPGLEGASPVRIVVDSGFRLPADSRLVKTAGEVPTWIICGGKCNGARRQELEARGVRVLEVHRREDGRLSMDAMLLALGELGLTRVLIEGGASLATSLLMDGLIDRIVWFSAPRILGADSLPTVADLGLENVSDAARWQVIARHSWQDDHLIMLRAAP